MRTIARFLAACSVFLCVQSGTLANLTNTWPFTTASDYQVSNSNLIEVAGGVAKLKLIADQKHRSTVSNYAANGTVQEFLKSGPDLSVCLSKSGGVYRTSGTFTSRVMDGSAGNSWQSILAKAYNYKLENAGNALSGVESGLVGLWHMDGNWYDTSPRSNTTTSLGAGFSQSAVLGSSSGNFTSGDAEVGSGCLFRLK